MVMGRAQSPVVDRTLHKKQSVQTTRSTVLWGLLNLVLVCALYTDM